MSEFGDCSVRKIVFNEDRDLNTHAIESPGLHPLTYKDLQIQVLYGVKKLNALGFHRNDRIAVITPAGPETAVAIITVMTGFTVVALDPQIKKTGISKLLVPPED